MVYTKINTVIAQQPSKSLPTEALQNYIMSPSGLVLVGALGVVGVISLLGDSNKKGKLATSYWGGSSQKEKAKKKALDQIENPQRNSAALYINTPEEIREKLNEQWLLEGYKFKSLKKNSSLSTLFVPDIQRGIAVSGSAGTGKTYSVIDPLLRSALDQGFPTILYDYKFPTQASRCVAYALKRGYRVRFFTPGFTQSDICNIFDFLKDEEDAVAAGQLAHVISKNIELNANASSDKFFEDAGATLVEGIFLLTKAVGARHGREYADLITASEILSLPSLGKRLEYARSIGQFSAWTMRPLAQLISVSGSPETESSIIGTAQRIFQKFLKKDFIGAFCGQSTLPLDLDGKEMIVFGLERNNRDIIAPLMTAIMHMIIQRNISRPKPRADPLCLFLDEFPTLYLPQFWQWLTQNREDGFCPVLGFQNLAQLELVYGKEIARIIFGNCSTKFLFNPQEPDSAEYFSKILGSFEITYSTKSRSHSSGKSGGGSRSHSDNRQTRALLEIAQFQKLGVGRAVILSPAYSKGEEEYIPLKQKIKVAKSDRNEMDWSAQNWRKIWEYFGSFRFQIMGLGKDVSKEETSDESLRQQYQAELLRQQSNARFELVNQVFPLPPNAETTPTAPPPPVAKPNLEKEQISTNQSNPLEGMKW